MNKDLHDELFFSLADILDNLTHVSHVVDILEF